MLEVIADVRRRYRVDPDRIYLMGHSMGGYGTNNVAMHHPDLFAAVAPAEGTGSPELHANLRNTPWFMMTAEEDLDVRRGRGGKALYASLSADGYDATLLDYSLKIHEYSSIYDTLPRLLGFFASPPGCAPGRRWSPGPGRSGRTGQPCGRSTTAPGGCATCYRQQGVTLPTVTVESMAMPARRARAGHDDGPDGRRGRPDRPAPVPGCCRPFRRRKAAAVEPNSC